MDNVSIETTQQVSIDYEVADIGERIFAFILDSIVIGIYLIITLVWMFEVIGGSNAGLFYLLIFLPVALYHLLFEYFWNGQSLGKRALSIKVVRMDGTRPGIGNYLMRWIFRLFEISMTSGMVALCVILFNGKGQRIGDMAAGTTVVKNRRRTSLDDTMVTDIEDGYEPRFSTAAELTDQDVAIIKEVLNSRYEYDRNTFLTMLDQTRNKVAGKLGISVSDETNSRQFLQTILKDYNYLHGRK